MIFCLAGIPGVVCAQELSHQVLVPFAGVTSGKSIDFSQTGGETMIEVIGCSDFDLTQGFQQPRIIFPTYEPPVPPGTGADVYPNPVTDFLTLKLWCDKPKTFRIDIFNITGTTLLSLRKVFSVETVYIEPLSLENLLRGIYIVRISTEDRLLDTIFKIEKL